jgi:hypothetical protein
MMRGIKVTQSDEIEISELDTRFEELKTKDPEYEKKLVGDLLVGSLLTPLLTANIDGAVVLLDGFKRRRAALHLKWTTISCQNVAECEVSGIIELLQRSRGHKMNLYAEACFVSRLQKVHSFNVGELATTLGRSKGWVSMRTLFTADMSLKIENKLRSGEFPFHAWMYSVKPFTRMNDTNKLLVEEFVLLCIKGKHTLREIDILARIWFEQGEDNRKEMRKGNARFILKRLDEKVQSGSCMSAKEQESLKVLDHVERALSKCNSYRFGDLDNSSREYRSQGHLCCTTILANLRSVKTKLEALHDQCGKS